MAEPEGVRSGVVEVAGGELAYTDRGAGEPLLLVHGLSGSGRWWRRNVEALSRHRRVITVDLLGFGGSRRGRFVMAAAAGQLVALLDALDLPRASVVGHSLGGAVALTLAAASPRRVAALVLVDAAVLPRDVGPARHGAGLLRAFGRLPLDFLPVLFADAWRAGPLNVWRAAREVLGADLEPVLAQVRAPTLVVWGDRDTAVPLAVGERLVAALPDARLAVLPRVGHNPMWEAPAAFHHLVEEFLGEAVAPAAATRAAE